MLAACGSARAPADGAACFPPDARPWIAATPQTAPGHADPGGPMKLFIDGSASMAGFIAGGTGEDRPFADLVRLLPALDGIDHHAVSAARFDRRMHDVPMAQLSAMEGAAAYLCPRTAPDCDRNESHLADPLDAIAAERTGAGALSLVLSDLWLDDRTLRTSGTAALARPLDAILESGRAIAVYGFESPYAGRIADLPSGRRDVTARRHPFYLIAVGPTARLAALDAALATSASPAIARAFASGRVGRALFTPEPRAGELADDRPLVAQGAKSLAETTFLKVRAGVGVQQFALDRSAALRAAIAKPEPGAVWRGIPANAFRPGAVWRGPVTGTTAVYRLVSERCDARDWQPLSPMRGGWSGGASPGFTLDPANAARLPTGDYLLVGRALRVSLDQPNRATAWMRDWSFDADTEAAAVNRPVMPTLRLAEIARLLEAASMHAAQRRPVPIGGFAVGLRVR